MRGGGGGGGFWRYLGASIHHPSIYPKNREEFILTQPSFLVFSVIHCGKRTEKVQLQLFSGVGKGFLSTVCYQGHKSETKTGWCSFHLPPPPPFPYFIPFISPPPSNFSGWSNETISLRMGNLCRGWGRRVKHSLGDRNCSYKFPSYFFLAPLSASLSPSSSRLDR